MPAKNKWFVAYPTDGSIITDRKAYLQYDCLISDKHKMALPPGTEPEDFSAVEIASLLSG